MTSFYTLPLILFFNPDNNGSSYEVVQGAAFVVCQVGSAGRQRMYNNAAGNAS